MIGKEWLLHLVNCMPRPVEYVWCFTIWLMLKGTARVPIVRWLIRGEVKE